MESKSFIHTESSNLIKFEKNGRAIQRAVSNIYQAILSIIE